MNKPLNTIGAIRENKEALEKIIHLLASGSIPVDGSYLSWQQLGQAMPPEYLVLREWWLGLKLQRLLGRQEIGLKDAQGLPFTLGSTEFFAAIIHRMDRAREITANAHEAPRGLKDQIAVWALREEAVASTQLDGLEIDTVTARELLRTGRKPENAAEQAVRNTYRVLQRLREICARPLTLALLAEFHQQLTLGTVAKTGGSGRLRLTTDETQPPADQLPARLKAMLTFANGRTPEHFVHPLLRAAALHFWVRYDQPFAEGNGRLARALYYWCVLHAGYAWFETLSLSAVERDAPAAYQAAHDEVARDENDLLHFAAHVLQTTTKARQRSADKITRLAEEQHAAASLPVAAKNLNPRQSLLVARALKEPAFRRTLQEHARDYNLARQTSRNDFAPLVKLGWFEEAKIGRALAFFPAPDLAARVEASMTERT